MTKSINLYDILVLLELNMEICGYVENHITTKYKKMGNKKPRKKILTHNLELISQNPGERLTGYDTRGSCSFEKRNILEWHTHPNGLAPWPSVEDIFGLITRTPTTIKDVVL